MSAYKERAAHAWTEDSVRLIATPSSWVKSAFLYVQEIGYFRTLAPYFTEREQLDSYLLVYTVSGKGRLTYGGNKYELKPNQAFLIDCKEYQHYATDPDEPWELLWVHMNGAGADKYYEAYQTGDSPVVALPQDSGVPALLRELIALQQERTIRSELACNRLLVALLTEILLAAPELGSMVTDAPAFILQTMRHMEQHYHERITLDHLAEIALVNKYHLAKEFKRYTGFSPNEFLINARMSRAKELLKYSDTPVAVIAQEIGIDNVSHFIRLFKDRIDETPLAFRKHWQRPR